VRAVDLSSLTALADRACGAASSAEVGRMLDELPAPPARERETA
jgi:hypothetical protein